MTRTPFRFATWMLPLLLTVSLRSALAVADDPVAAIPVSPGDSQAGALIGDPCPSFSWGAVAGAQRYELAIFDAQWDDSPGYEDQQRQGVALRRIEIDAPALSWTPAGSECLDEGGSYLWFVRAATAAGEEEPWSAPRYFAIDYDADALTQTVRRELAAQLSQPGVWREVIQTALSGNRTLALTPLASAALMPAAPSDTAAREGGTGGASAGETLAISPQATTFPYPSALKVNSPNGVVFNQSASLGGIPAEGAGTRFMWYAGKGALRAGSVDSTQWDRGNVGFYSMAMGYGTIASDSFSIAMGYGTTASRIYSTATGRETIASGESSTAMGYGTAAIGYTSTALGDGSTASATGSTAMGGGTTASGAYSTAMGFLTYASGDYSMAMGKSTIASYGSMAMGEDAQANGRLSTAMGFLTTASGGVSTAMGSYTTAQSYNETAIGRWNALAWLPDPNNWVSTDRLFVIGNGTSSGARSNALVVLKNGNVGIGTSTPTYRLQLGFDSAAKPGSTTWTVASDARLKDITSPYESGLAEIAALQPVRYHYAVDNARGHDPEPEYVGFIAQQAQAVFPEAVNEGADGYLDFNMHAVNVAMVNAIKTLGEQNQELQAQLLAQEAQIAALRGDKVALAQRLSDQEDRNATLTQRLVSLEAEQRRSANLQAQMASLQAQMQVLHTLIATGNGQVAMGR